MTWDNFFQHWSSSPELAAEGPRDGEAVRLAGEAEEGGQGAGQLPHPVGNADHRMAQRIPRCSGRNSAQLDQ